MSSIDNLQGITSNLLSTSTQNSTLLDNITEQSFSTLTSFSELFSLSQEVNAVQETALSLTPDNVSSNLKTMQDELLSNLLGYNSGISALASTEQLTDISTDFSLGSIKDSLQSSILSTLQANTVLSNTEQEITPEKDIVSNFISFAFNDDGLGVEDAFDALNIFQHIPIVSTVYSTVTKQEDISTVAQLAGDFLYGGPVGLAYSALDLAIESYTGTSINDAITQFDYGDFLFGQISSAGTELATSTTSTKTAFFDKNSQVIYSRD